MDVVMLALAKKYANGIASGIKSYSVDGLTLKIVTTSGQTLTMNFPSPKVKDIDITPDGYIIFTLEDGTEIRSEEAIPSAKISAQPGNSIFQKADGLYVPAGAVDISEDEGNAIETRENGLYVATVEGGGGSADQVTYDNSETTYPKLSTNVQAILTDLNALKTTGKYYKVKYVAYGHGYVEQYNSEDVLLNSKEDHGESWASYFKVTIDNISLVKDEMTITVQTADVMTSGVIYNGVVYTEPNTVIFTDTGWGDDFNIVINELAHVNSGAEFVSYSNQDSELTAKTVKGAIDEIDKKIPKIDIYKRGTTLVIANENSVGDPAAFNTTKQNGIGIAGMVE